MSKASVSDKKEALRSAVAFIRMSNDRRLGDMLRYWKSLNEFEQGCLLGSLSQLSQVGVAAMAAVNGVSFDECLTVIEAELTASESQQDQA